MRDASTCISVGTITEPDCLGPCEPGTSVMLEGIVWQETEGGNGLLNIKIQLVVQKKLSWISLYYYYFFFH